MFLERFIDGFAKRKSGAWILGGIASLFEGVERLMSVPGKKRGSLQKHAAPVRRNDFFSIRRSGSDLGLAYWVLQGHGVYASFQLFDTWREAMSAAEARLAIPLLAPTGREELSYSRV